MSLFSLLSRSVTSLADTKGTVGGVGTLGRDAGHALQGDTLHDEDLAALVERLRIARALLSAEASRDLDPVAYRAGALDAFAEVLDGFLTAGVHQRRRNEAETAVAAGPVRYRVLSAIAHGADCNGALAGVLGISQQHVSNELARLHDEGLIQPRRELVGDRRRKPWALTSAGLGYLERIPAFK